MSAADSLPSPSCILAHLPEPDPPRLIDLPLRRPAVGEEILPGWKVCDHNLVRGDWNGNDYAYEVWLMPTSSDCC